ncbi:MAG TPA: BrnT family toxin [Ignavibacteria bacterium]
MNIFDNITGFDWDKNNLEKSLIKHNVTSKESEDVFKDENIILTKEVNAKNEKRYVVFGVTPQNRFLTVVFTVRNNLIKVISARTQNKSERKIYNEKNKKNRKEKP